MMSNHEFTNWTALPNGIIGETVRLSVFVTPKLLGVSGTFARLENYQAILNWPETINKLGLKVFVEIDGGITLAPLIVIPANKGELGPSSTLWNSLFYKDMLVEPFATDPAPAVLSASRKRIPVFYRSAPLQALVEESYAVQSRRALADLESEPRQPTFVGKTQLFDPPDALLDLAAGPTPALAARQFAQKEGDRYSYQSAHAVTQFFGEGRLDRTASALSISIDSPLSRDQVSELFTAFSLYHRRGIRNRLQQIRAPRRWASSDPNFNFYESDIVQIAKDEHGKEFEFAESHIAVSLPELTSAEKGFEIVITYSPNEALPAPSDDADVAQIDLRAADEVVNRYGRDLTVRTSGSNLFQDGSTSTQISAQRAKRICWNGARWIPLDRNDLDFHAVLSSLSSYPSLLRRLGWIFDVEIPLKDLFPEYTLGARFTGKIRVEPVWNDPQNAPNYGSPWTLYKVGEHAGSTQYGISLTSFIARSDPSLPNDPIAAGFRDLSKSRIFQYDLDAAVIKTVQKAIREADPSRFLPSHRIEIPGSPRAAALNATRRATDLLGRKIDIDPEHRAAAIRSTGLSLYADREYVNFAQLLTADTLRVANFANTLKASLANLSPAASESYIDDVYLNAVVAGYVIDVRDDVTKRWHSLCERQVVFEFEDQTLPKYLAPADEGWVSGEGMVEIDEDGNSQLRINESFFRWDGWSLVAPNPGEKLRECNPVETDPPPRNIGVSANVELKPLSLLKLRYGRTYSFRARIADLAGNTWPLAYADRLNTDALISQPTTYRRFDPINPPFLVPLQPPGPGSPAKLPDDAAVRESKGPEKGEMLVIRSGIDAGAASGEWLVVSPEVKFQEAEWIGMFDAFDKPDKAFSVLSRYCGDLPDTYDPKFISRITWPGGKLATPYLPDGHAKGAAFRYLPGGFERKQEDLNPNIATTAAAALTSTKIFSFELDLEGPARKGKPFAQPFYFRLVSGKTRKPPKHEGRRLTVTLPPGEQQLIRVSTTPDERLDLFAQVHNTFEAMEETFLVQPRDPSMLGTASWGALKALTPALKKAILAGQFWPLTPQKNLYLVHAVPKPLLPVPKTPNEIAVFRFSDSMTAAPRPTNAIATVLHDPTLRVHRASTGRIDVYAEWDEYSDVSGSRICPLTKRRRHLCFSSDVDLPDLTIEPDESHVTVDFGQRHEFPTTKHYAVKYQMIATTRYREYYDPKFTAILDNITIKSEESKLVHILNTVPPPSLEISYVLPILIWDDPIVPSQPEFSKGALIQRRVRRGLRIYLQRNWYASGEEEQVAIIFAPKTAAVTNVAQDADPDNQVPVTQWGANPIWHTSPIKRQPVVEDSKVAEDKRFRGIMIPKMSKSARLAELRNAGAQISNAEGEVSSVEEFRKLDEQVVLKPEEVQMVDVASLPINCDVDKDLNYVDVELNEIDSYSYMVKFTLARFQPFSAPYAHLSPVTNWVFHAIAPERLVAYGIASEINEDPDRPTKQVKFTIGGVVPGNLREGYSKNSLEVLLFDGDAIISERQIPLTVSDSESGFRFPLTLLENLKRPNVHIKEFEYVGGADPRLVFACHIPLQMMELE